jgi:phosphonoacetaldehyde hydrolase
MNGIARNKTYRGPILGVVLDWAGTAVDYGCVGPVAVFVEIFKQFNVEVTVVEARSFMGLMKKDHIRGMCGLPSVQEQWLKAYGRMPAEEDVETMFASTEAMMRQTVSRHADPISGLKETIRGLRERKIKIGSSTGYTSPIMKKLVQEAAKKGYVPDAVVCSSDVPAGRPFPWMCYANAIQMGVYPMVAMVKIGDTVSDIEEGLNAGMWTVGLTKSGNELGLTEEEVARLDTDDLKQKLSAIEQTFMECGAHYVAEGIWDCLPIIDDISKRMAAGERP